jgi:hypothetical protein
VKQWLDGRKGSDDGSDPSRPSDGPPSAGGTRPATGDHQIIPGTIYRKPDPMIYDQYYLMSQGFAVTWDNPDIHLERPLGNRVSSHDLLPSTTYHVVARVWNLSETAPAPRMPIRFSYLRFGIGGGKTPFAESTVDLAVKGAPGLPALGMVEWTTPSVAGHYCLQAELIWPPKEDANPDNNLGQLNTDVKALKSPATFTVPVRNDDLLAHKVIRLHVDTYQIPPLEACDEDGGGLDEQRQGAATRARHSRERFEVPAGWAVQAVPAELSLPPGHEEIVTVTVTAPAGFVGRQPFNVNGIDDTGLLLGGVTLYVEGH